MSDKNDSAQKGAATRDWIVVRTFEYGDNAKIMDIDFSMKGVRVYRWRDGKLVKGTEYFDDDDLSSEAKKEIVERIGPQPGGPGGVYCCAFAGDSMVGYMVLFLYPSEKHMWGIAHCFVSSEYRRQGIATRMFAFAKQEAIQKGAKEICFLSAINESAVDFYLSVGFTPFEKPPEDERWSGWDGEDIYMEMKL